MAIGLYQTGVSGLLAAQQQLATTGHNISNVNTEGYTRQRAEQNAAVGLFNGGNFIGSGTYIEDITRIYDQFSYREQLLSKNTLGNAETLHADLNKLNEVMSTSGESVNNSIKLFYQAVNSLADKPNEIGLRNITLSQADRLASDFRSMHDSFDRLEKSINGEVEQITKKISEISKDLANINEQILFKKSATISGQPNDILDSRDKLLLELSELTRVDTVTDENGVMTVMIGNGTTLVAGITAFSLDTRSGDPDAKKLAVHLVAPHGAVNLSSQALGGTLSAKLEFRDQHLVHARNEVDRMAMAMSSTINDAHTQGLDLNGVRGTNLFTDINTTALQQGRVLYPTQNTGTLQAAVNITDVSQLQTEPFEISLSGGNYILTNTLDGATTNLGAPGAGYL